MKYLLTLSFSCLLVWSIQAQCNSAKTTFLGVYTNNMSKTKAKKLQLENPYGSYVKSIIKNTAADRLGLQAFDYVVGINDEEMSEDKNLTRLLRQYEPGETVSIHYIRKGKRNSKSVELGTKAEADYSRRSRSEDPFLGVTHNDDRYSKNPDGARVNIVTNSSAEELGLQNGDVITTINEYPIYDWEDLSAGIDMLQVGEVISVTYLREGRQQENKTTIRSLAATKKGEHHHHYNYRHQRTPKNRRVEPNRTGSTNFELAKRDVSGMAIDMEEMSEEEVVNMNEQYEIDMPLDNNLVISTLNLAPNPNRGLFDLQFNLNNKGDTSINIFNALGRNIYNYELSDFSGEFRDAIDISQNGTGLYFIEIRQGNKSIVKKIVLKES